MSEAEKLMEPDELWIMTKRGHSDSNRRYAMSRAYQRLSVADREKYMEERFPLYDEIGVKIPETPDKNYITIKV